MVKGRNLLAFSALGLAAAAVASPHARKTASTPAHTADGQHLLNCNAHKFETVVEEIVDGQPHQSKVKLCGKDGQSNADWLRTLKDAVAKLELNSQMPKAVRDQIVTALNREIIRLGTSATPEARSGLGALGEVSSSDLTSITAKKARAAPQAEIASEYSPLPPLTPSAPEAATLPPPRQIVSSAPATDYAALPPLPTAPPPPTHVLMSVASSSGALLPKPKMTLTCYTPGELSDGPCTGFSRNTLVTVRADEDLPSGTGLRFVRDGDPKADVVLAQLKRGRSMQLTVPADVCSHVVGGKLELRILRSGEEVGSEGPYNLNC